MTTNGVTLPLMAEKLRAAGLNRINISLDSLNRDRFKDLTRRDNLEQVLEGIDAARVAGFDPVKINMVVMKGINDDEILDFVGFGREKRVTVRFIEFMPLDADEEWSNDRVMSLTEILKLISAHHEIVPMQRGNAPAARWKYTDGAGEIGVIATVTEAFCESCDRIRLTADGKFRNCLFALKDYDMRNLLRNGASDDDIANLFVSGVQEKWAGHQIGKSVLYAQVNPCRRLVAKRWGRNSRTLTTRDKHEWLMSLLRSDSSKCNGNGQGLYEPRYGSQTQRRRGPQRRRLCCSRIAGIQASKEHQNSYHYATLLQSTQFRWI